MKTLLLFSAVAALVASSQAASINWTITGNTTYVLKDYNDNAYASTVYLVAASDLSSITDLDSKSAFEDALDDLTIVTTSSSSGTKPSVSKQVVTDDRLTAGTPFKFGLLVVSEDSDGNGYYKVLNANGTPYATGADASAQTTLTTPWNTLGSQSWVSAWTKPTEPITPEVPEPATGALALAGVALLFKRRRA
jgi:hypothetical protein